MWKFLRSIQILTSPFVGELQKLRYKLHWMVLLRLCVEFECVEKWCCELYCRHDLWICGNFLSLVKKAAPHLKLILFFCLMFRRLSFSLTLPHFPFEISFVLFVAGNFFLVLLSSLLLFSLLAQQLHRIGPCFTTFCSFYKSITLTEWKCQCGSFHGCT